MTNSKNLSQNHKEGLPMADNLGGGDRSGIGSKTQDAADFVPVLKTSELPEAGKTVVEVGDRVVALFHVSGTFWAIDDECTHDGGPLAEGRLEGYTIECPRHGARFDIRDGRALSMPATQPTVAHEVKVEGDQVFIRLNENS